MHERHLEEVKNLINLSFLAIEELAETIDNLSKGNSCRNMNLAWHHINGILMYTARISRILWGKEGYSKERGEDLRTILSISEDSIFHYQNRKVRNALTHIDERIDKYEDGELEFLNRDFNMGDDIESFIGNMEEGDYARFYEIKTRTIYFGSHSLSIPKLEKELSDLKEKVDNYLSD